MKRAFTVLAVAASAFAMNVGIAAAGGTTTVTHYTADYTCDCGLHWVLSGVHLTNPHFTGADFGPDSDQTVGGRDNFTGTVDPAFVEETTTLTGPGGANCADEDKWQSDYNHHLFTCSWSMTLQPDGSVSGWAIYPNASS
jgi:hypothetical protein